MADPTPSKNEKPAILTRKRRMAGMLPTLLTLGNLVCGFAAIIAATKDETTGLSLPFGWSPLKAACMFILLGMVCDALDGTAARLTRTMSRMGAELDSLADVVTFGLAPAVMACKVVGMDIPFIAAHWDDGHWLHKCVFGAAAVYISCAALRLAWYNVEDASPDAHGGFTGLPSPGAAGAVVGLIMLYGVLGDNKDYGGMAQGITAVAVVLGLLLLGLAMVSRMPYTHMVNRMFKGRARIMRLLPLLAVGGVLVVWPTYVLPACFLGYALSGPVLAVLRRIHPARI